MVDVRTCVALPLFGKIPRAEDDECCDHGLFSRKWSRSRGILSDQRASSTGIKPPLPFGLFLSSFTDGR